MNFTMVLGYSRDKPGTTKPWRVQTYHKQGSFIVHRKLWKNSDYWEQQSYTVSHKSGYALKHYLHDDLQVACATCDLLAAIIPDDFDTITEQAIAGKFCERFRLLGKTIKSIIEAIDNALEAIIELPEDNAPPDENGEYHD